ncbi:hypothetical protein CEP51_005350 [Fusarium floridanum]|uniref:Protein kinase domain-containing protein n=1 Tax=Fusarium floridanum TaxID=1325733 RepID=A0A428RXA8_9HYPO|nr:hypothetical protein CEP51_005350 [Fusarium floridanum]
MQCRDYRRFPFLAETPIGEGSFGTITKFEIAPGYCDKAEKVLMRDYHRSAVGHGNEKKLLFAAKSVKDSDPNSHALVLDELRVLRLVSKLDNVITLLACYTWREKTYFVFPYVETDLEELLTDKINIEGKKPLTLQSSKELPHHWLWKEMVGVTNALKHIHGGIKDPSERTSGDVIGFHSDLKPANILVTANGKLKIGDFGLSYIQIMKAGDVFEAEYQGGEVRYAAPESKLSPDERGELLRPCTNDPAPVLKLDIWSLACIMTEVLVRLVNPKGKESPLKHFRDELVQCQEGGGYEQRSFDKEGVKQCVKDTIDALKAKGSARSAIGQYLSSIAELLLAMFQHNNSSRLSSQDVLLRLRNAKEEYRGNLKLDGPGWELKEQSPPEDQNLWEVGWINKNNRLVSFIKMEGIELEAVKQVDGNPQLKRKCRFRLFERRPSPERERPSHESERSGHTAVPTFVLKYAVEEGAESKAYEEDINLSDWAFKPTYLFQKLPGSKPRYECLLFLVKRTSSSKALVFTFASIKGRFSDATAKFDVYGSPRVDTLDSASVQFWSSIQPKYLPRTGRGPPEPLSQKDETMVIFCPKKSLLKIPLNDGKKDFRLAKREQDKVQISHKEKSGHRYFDVFEFKYQPCDPWDKKTGESETKFTTPALQLQHESDKTLVKVKEMTIATTGRSSQGAQDGDIEKLKLATGMKTRKNRR